LGLEIAAEEETDVDETILSSDNRLLSLSPSPYYSLNISFFIAFILSKILYARSIYSPDFSAEFPADRVVVVIAIFGCLSPPLPSSFSPCFF